MKPTITECEIGPYPVDMRDRMPEVKVKFSDGTSKVLFHFYPDEISFMPVEFIGLTEVEAHALYTLKDTQYLQS